MSSSPDSPLKLALAERGDGAQADLARKLGVNDSMVYRWANRDVRPRHWYRKQIARHLGMKQEELWP